MSTNLHTVAVFVTELEPARIFYEDALGLPLAAQGSFGFQFGEAPPFLGVHPAVHDGAKAMVGRETGVTLRVSDLLGLRTALSARGIELLTEPVQQGFGMMAMIADPDGNIFALWEDNVTEDEE